MRIFLRIVHVTLRIICFLAPFPGIFIPIIYWIIGDGEEADELLFFCFIGIFFSVIFWPLFFLIRSLVT